LEVVELDRDLAAMLPARLGSPGNLRVHQADALAFDFAALAEGEMLRVVGNLPYNISTPLLFHLLDQTGTIRDMHFMLQKELVERLDAGPGSKLWGRLGVMTAARADASCLFTVPSDAFRPAPKVESAVVRIVPRALSETEKKRLPALEAIVRKAFGQRRKTLRNTLDGMISAGQLEDAGIDPGQRAESVSLAQFCRLADQFIARQTNRP
ncbi:MAG: 16S rRNA (adenine(1518)-N(6)/adenine(1519)-N(6))-dimethyltransferase RsmA, partial [Wenzhouxiangellaceae bacterium]